MRRRLVARAACFGLALLLLAAHARAGGGARNVLVVVNENSEESLEIGNYYLHARGLPAANLCRIQTTTGLTTDKAGFQAEIEAPIKACIAASPYAARIDYIVLTRGMPISAYFPDPSNPPVTSVSMTALLQAMDTALDGKDQEYGGPAYGFQNYPNPYLKQDQYFSHAKLFGGYKLYISTMLSGYWSSDGTALVDRSLASDAAPPTATGGLFYLEDASPAADVRNPYFDQAVTRLATRGYSATHVLLADPNVTSSVVASHINGGAYSAISQADINSCTYPAGALVDVLESFGLVPQNFDPDQGIAQVPATWWVTAGATGVQGTVYEPYNVAFPDGFMLEPYVDGYNLGETWYQGIPYLYWMNLVLGDPLAAPYAKRPVVLIAQPVAGGMVSGTQVSLSATASTPKPTGIKTMEFFIDNQLVASPLGGSSLYKWDSTTVADGWHRFEVVAYENSKYYTQTTAGVDFQVANAALQVAISDPVQGTQVAGTFQVTITASPAITGVSLAADGYVVGTASGGSPFFVAVDSNKLGRGTHTLIATGDDGAGKQALSRPVDIVLVKPVRLHAYSPNNGPISGGTAVAIDGWNFDSAVQVAFGSTPAQSVLRSDANHLVAVTAPAPAGTVDIHIVNPLGLDLVIPGGYTYNWVACAVAEAVPALRLVKVAGGNAHLAWSALSDPCLDSYRVYSAADPATPPVFPADYTELTDLDLDGNIGGDASFLYPPPVAGLLWYQVVGRGSDGSLGPP